ncbi:hypothetical protein AMATHDRAFT_50769 [Amanita thiersii Skay4041]|uniref:ARID domain-containing protein n=1 Tax=Amanita thiersii Skay4041 TaxID=703135 RepID=A0A2A9N9S3_9AGAR|nr:hypothetical protein AMATHDRAFT_50769 [Amanita thiersii Skay4041]
MADRLQYPMLPTYGPALMHQQQQAQQQSQQIQSQQIQSQHSQQQDSHPSLPNFSDNNRMWHQVQQMQQMRPHPDMNSTPQNSQFADLFRNQTLNRLQQSQHHQQSQQLASGISMPQMSTNPAVTSQSQLFQGMSSGQQQSSHMPVGFPGMSNPGVGISPTAAALQSRNALVQNFPRQYELVVAQNQQLQNGTIGFGNRQQSSQSQLPPQATSQQQMRDASHIQSSAINHPSATDIFSSPNMSSEVLRRPSPSHPSISAQHMQGGMSVPVGSLPNQGTIQNPSIPFAHPPLQEQLNLLRNNIRSLEQSIARSGAADSDPMTRARLVALLATRKEQLGKLIAIEQAQARANGGGGQLPWLLSQQQNSSQGPFDTSVQMSRNNPGVQTQQSVSQTQLQQQQTNTNLNSSVLINPPSQSGQVPAPSTVQIQSNGPSAGGPSFPPQIQGTTNTSSPFAYPSLPGNSAVTQHQPQSSQHQHQQIPRATLHPGNLPTQVLQTIPPLDKARFDQAFKNYCANKQIKIDPRMLTLNNTLIDLHLLHSIVMQEGGEAKVQQKDLWSAIGGRMGFVQFPGTETEPAKCGPALAQQLEHLYKQYLAPFDRAYIANMLDARVKVNQGQLPFTPAQLNLMVAMADQPVHVLRAHGLTESMIQFMETHRAHLQRVRIEREGFHEAIKPNNSDQASQSQGSTVVNAQQVNTFSANQVNSSNGISTVSRQPPSFLQPNNVSTGGHALDNRQQPSQGQHVQPIAGAGGVLTRPTREQMQNALAVIHKAKEDAVKGTVLMSRVPVTISTEQRMEYNALIEQVHRQALEIESKLPLLCIYSRREDLIRRVILISVTVHHQRSLLSSGNPRLYTPLEQLRVMAAQMQQATEMCTHLFVAIAQQQKIQQLQYQGSLPQQTSPSPSVPRPGINARNPFTASDVSVRRPNLPQVQSSPPHAPSQHISAEMPLQQPPLRKPAPPAPIGGLPTSSPVPTSAHTPSSNPIPSVSTPANAPPTPALAPASSPQTPKSPKGKVPAKPKVPITKQRRPSKPIPPATPTESPVQVPTPPTHVLGVKRPREEDNLTDSAVPSPAAQGNTVVNEFSPPKRPKTDWELPPSEQLKQKAEAKENIETTDDANAFLEQVSELLKRAADTEGRESTLPADLSETLGMILKGCSTVPDGQDHGFPTMRSIDASVGRDSPPPSGFKDAFEEFIDFSFGQQDGQLDDDEGSKAHTPDLVSSTNLSPESNVDGDNNLQLSSIATTSDIKKEEHPDLRLGLWKEFDGGESAYYQPFEWKWDSPMPVLEQSWAVGTS